MVAGALSAAAAMLLIVAGVAKLRVPRPAAAMLLALLPPLRSMRRARLLARTLGLVEVAIGLSALLLGDRVAYGVLAVGYLVLAVVAVRLARSPEPTACGCFGAADGAVTTTHVVCDLACLVAAVCGAVVAPGPVSELFSHGMLSGVVASVQVVLLVALGYLSMTALPMLMSARREVEHA